MDEMGIELAHFHQPAGRPGAAALVLTAARDLYAQHEAEPDYLPTQAQVVARLSELGELEAVGGALGVMDIEASYEPTSLTGRRNLALDVRGRQLYRQVAFATNALDRGEPGAVEWLADASAALSAFRAEGAPGEGYVLPDEAPSAPDDWTAPVTPIRPTP